MSALHRIFSVGIALFFCFAVTACGSDDSGGGNKSADKPSEDVRDTDDARNDAAEPTPDTKDGEIRDATPEDTTPGADIDDTDDTEQEDSADADAIASESSLIVHLTGPKGKPLADGSVKVIDGPTGETDQTGRVVFDGLPAGKHTVAADASGYAKSGFSIELPSEQRVSRTLPLPTAGDTITFPADEKATLQTDNATVQLPANSLVRADNGVQPTGSVKATITSLIPGKNPISVHPGPIVSAPTEPGDSTTAPFEMVSAVHIHLTANGQKLELAEGKQASVEFTIPDSMRSEYTPGMKVPMGQMNWHRGFWEIPHNGEIQQSETGAPMWQSEVNHFSWVNAHQPWSDLGCVKVQVSDPDGQSLDHAMIEASVSRQQGVMSHLQKASKPTCVPVRGARTNYIHVRHPEYFMPEGESLGVQSPGTDSTCSTADGCETKRIQLDPGTCVRGKVLDRTEQPVSEAEISALYRSQTGQHIRRARFPSGSDGEYCIQVPKNSSVKIRASKKLQSGNDAGDRARAEKAISTGTEPGTCETSCQSGPALILDGSGQ